MTTEFITIIDCCDKHHIETSFIHSLQEAGLIEVRMVEAEESIHLDQLPELEKFIRWKYDLEINNEGIETVSYLLHKIAILQSEVAILKQQLKLHS